MSTEVPETVPASSLPEGPAAPPEVDVLVVGFGIAGACAAVEAAAAGARVHVLERAAVPGGTTAMAGGHFYLGGGTAVQRATGHDDSPEEMARYLTAVALDPEPEKIWAYAHDSVEHFDWLEGLGFEFERSYFPEKAVIQPRTEGLMYTGNEKVWPFREQARPAPRGHKVPVPGDTKGASMVVDLLVARARELGVEVSYETGATGLVVDEDGAVVGVTWRRFQETGAIRAGAVVLAAGGFVMNPEMVAEHVPQLAEKPFVLGSTYDDGLGIRLGLSAGGATRHLDQAFVTAPVYPPSRLLTGIVVNKRGERFVAEDSYHSRTSAFALEQPDATAYLVVDSEHMEKPDFPLAPFVDGWETVAEMEQGLGIPEGRLAATLDRYNEHAARGEDPDFHKAPEWVEPQDKGPWGAFDLTLGKALYAGFTLGGLRTSVDAEVLREDGSVVRGLYAAGACAANIAQDGKGYSSGTQLGEGSYFGRRAGRHAARRPEQGRSTPLDAQARP
ncbi:MAG TPA: FAD-binding protein [Nocardioidaceae bacterium]|nr:FAD-binding protein [Nocardioidaceae bacterium]